MQNVVLLGHTGNIGRRYNYLLRRLGINVIGWDLSNINDRIPVCPDHLYLVATPTDLHVRHVEEIICYDKSADILVEKPLCMPRDISTLEKLEAGSDCIIRMVNNWAYVIPGLSLFSHDIVYRYWNHGGKEADVHWTLCQAFALSKPGCLSYHFDSPVFDVRIDGCPVTQAMFDMSYLSMLQAWLIPNVGPSPWTLGEWKKISKKVQDMIDAEREIFK
jgi:hypothetical protein